MTNPVPFEVCGEVATITLDDQAGHNVLSIDLVNGLGDALTAAIGSNDIRVIVLTNTGPTFCAGADLKGPKDQEPRYDSATLLELILDAPKPVVGRIAGHCMGGGVGLAAACDISIAAADIRLGFTEVRLGVAPAIISVVCLPKLRRSDAMELFLTGEQIAADRAAATGLLTRSVPREDLDASVEATIAALLAGGPGAVAVAKQLVQQVPVTERTDAFRWTSRLSAELFASEEAQAGIAAFRNRQPPPWLSRSPAHSERTVGRPSEEDPCPSDVSR